MSVDISICMVSLNCIDVLKDCLKSLDNTDGQVTYECIIVDNASTDTTASFIETSYPNILLVKNTKNVGFSKATNQAISLSTGRYILWLNTDTILRPNSLSALLGFMENHRDAGIVGPKVLNRDGSFQPQCRRGLPTPMASLAYLLRLDQIWPANRQFGQYLLSYLPIDESNEVAAVSGCCLLARREVWTEIGPLDNDIFGFGEDLDWCVRAGQAGWQVWYYPHSEIIHLKGQGGAHAKPFHKIWGMHQAMRIFYRKHLASQYHSVVNFMVELGIGVSFSLSILSQGFRKIFRR